MGLAGRRSDLSNTWDLKEFGDDFIATPMTSGNFLSGTPVAIPTTWMTGPLAGNVQTSGVILQKLSGQIGGLAQLSCAATGAAEGTAFVQGQDFAMVSGGSLYARARLRPDEVTTSGALQFAFGLASAPFQSGLTLVNGCRTSGNCFAVGKTSGQQTFAMIANVQTSGLTVQTNRNCAGVESGQFYDVELFLNPERGNFQFTAKVNGQYLKTPANATLPGAPPIVLEFPQDSTPMGPYFGIKQGAGEAATLTVDKVYAQQSINYP